MFPAAAETICLFVGAILLLFDRFPKFRPPLSLQILLAAAGESNIRFDNSGGGRLLTCQSIQ
jgi:hypothetical protein